MKWIVPSLAAVFLLSGALYAGVRYERHAAWKQAYGDAQDAFRRAYDYKDAGALLYEPRLKDFQAADDRQRRISLVDSETQDDAESLHFCGGELATYREEGDAGLDAARISGPLGDKIVAGYIEMEKSADSEMQKCLGAQ